LLKFEVSGLVSPLYVRSAVGGILVSDSSYINFVFLKFFSVFYVIFKVRSILILKICQLVYTLFFLGHAGP